MTTEQLNELKRLAEAATPGPWWTAHQHMHVFAECYDCAELVDFVCESLNDTKDACADMDFIAAANPATVLALIAEVEQLRADKARLDALDNLHIESDEYSGMLTAWFDGDTDVTGYNCRDLADAILSAQEALP